MTGRRSFSALQSAKDFARGKQNNGCNVTISKENGYVVYWATGFLDYSHAEKA